MRDNTNQNGSSTHQDSAVQHQNPTLTDSFGRSIQYLRISVTDRCDFRCIYCMAEEMQFLPRKDVLSFEEITRLSRIFVRLGVKKIRLTGGEPLIRKDIHHLFDSLSAISQLEELCLTTNGSHLSEHAETLAQCGVKRINVSLDTLQPDRFKQLTRFGDLPTVLHGIETAQRHGLKIKLNAVLMKHYNLDEAIALTRYALSNDMDISFIEEMPLGEIKEHERKAEFISSEHLRNILGEQFTLSSMSDGDDHPNTGGPARYWQVQGYQNKVGFISPHSENFCASCNRIRITASGRLLLCLGNEHSIDLRGILRSTNDDEFVMQEIVQAMEIKPEKHYFDLDEEPQILRFMNATGG
ncbi:GTP 3',8-cyclase [Thalassocella blandensis]|nr:GTP 3',8-cyclase [Thalassocella blandensis]